MGYILKDRIDKNYHLSTKKERSCTDSDSFLVLNDIKMEKIISIAKKSCKHYIYDVNRYQILYIQY